MPTKSKSSLLGLLLAFASMIPASVLAQSVPLTANAVIIDNSPFYSIGPEDGIGGGNYALNHPDFIDIPYAIFDFGATMSVSNATLTWNFGSLFNSPPAPITLYVGNDADGVITTSDRFMGTAINTYTYSGGELRSYDVTSYVNASLASGPYFAARLEVPVPPWDLNGYLGGQFLPPSLTITSVPEPFTLALCAGGLGLALARRRKSK